MVSLLVMVSSFSVVLSTEFTSEGFGLCLVNEEPVLGWIPQPAHFEWLK